MRTKARLELDYTELALFPLFQNRTLVSFPPSVYPYAKENGGTVYAHNLGRNSRCSPKQVLEICVQNRKVQRRLP